MSRITRRDRDGEYKIDMEQICDAVRKLGRLEDRIEKEEKHYVEVDYKEIKEEGVTDEI